MVHVVSSTAFDLYDFIFRKSVVYDNHATVIANRTITETDIPGLTSPYSFSHSVDLWNGSGSFANATDFFRYAGSGLTANAFGSPISGTVTGLFVGDAQGEAAILGTSISAAAIRAASLTTTSRADDIAILRALLNGDDLAHLSDFGDRFYARSGNDTVFAGGGDDVIGGMQGRDMIYGEAGNDQLSGGFGYDRLRGGLGNDTISGDEGRDRLFGNQGGDVLFGGADGDYLSGGNGYDRMDGGTGADTLIGGLGKDRLDGGVDTVVDVFVFTATADSARFDQRDTIVHFTSGTDDIDLSQIDANTAIAGNQAFRFGGATAGANAVWLVKANNAVNVHADVNGDGVMDFSIRVTQVANLTAGDFLL